MEGKLASGIALAAEAMRVVEEGAEAKEAAVEKPVGEAAAAGAERAVEQKGLAEAAVEAKCEIEEVEAEEAPVEEAAAVKDKVRCFAADSKIFQCSTFDRTLHLCYSGLATLWVVICFVAYTSHSSCCRCHSGPHPTAGPPTRQKQLLSWWRKHIPAPSSPSKHLSHLSKWVPHHALPRRLCSQGSAGSGRGLSEWPFSLPSGRGW